MLSLFDHASMQAALQRDLDPRLHRLLTQRIGSLVTPAYDLTEWTHFLVVEAGDTDDDIIREIGFSPLVNPLDGARFGDPSFTPTWDWLTHHHGWFELITTVGNSAFAYIFLIHNAAGVPDDLLAMCRWGLYQ